jgi:hypothetical protein
VLRESFLGTLYPYKHNFTNNHQYPASLIGFLLELLNYLIYPPHPVRSSISFFTLLRNLVVVLFQQVCLQCCFDPSERAYNLPYNINRKITALFQELSELRRKIQKVYLLHHIRRNGLAQGLFGISLGGLVLLRVLTAGHDGPQGVDIFLVCFFFFFARRLRMGQNDPPKGDTT